MNTLFNRWLPCVTLAAWSAVLLIFHFNGKVTNLLQPSFRVYLPSAGVLLGVMALAFLFFRADASCCSSAECGHSLSRLASGKILTFLILLVPLSVAATFSPKAVRRTAIENRGPTEAFSSLGIKKPRTLAQADMPLPTKDSTPPAP